MNMKIDTSTLMRFLNNDLPAKKMQEINNIIKKNNQIKLRLEEIKNFKKIFKDGIKRIENTKIPNHLEKQISIPNNKFNKEKITKKSFGNLYKIAAGILIIVSFGAIVSLPNKAYLSQNPLSKINNKSKQVHIFYKEETLDDFLSKNKNCSTPEEFIDENNKKIFAVSCNKN